MKIRLTAIASAAAVAAALWLAPAAHAQREGGPQAAPRGRGATGPAGPTPRLTNGKPDLSGLWANPYTPNMALRVVDPMTKQPMTFARQGEALKDAVDPKRTFDLPYTDWGLKKWKEYDPVGKGDYTGNCLPFGMSRNINSPHGLQIIHNADALAFLFEQNTWFHWVPTNDKFKWPEDLPDSWNGVSTGHWDGDTLVIVTKGFNGYTRLDTNGHPHSKQLVMTNTFLRTDSNTIQHTVTVHDPKTYTRDWMNVRTWRVKPYPDVIMEYSCEENNLPNILNGAIKVWHAPEGDDDQ